MKHAAIYGSAIVVCHAIVSLVHGLAHSELQIGLSPTETGFVLVVIGLCPLVAMGLLWTSWKTSGLVLLVLSMAGSLLLRFQPFMATIASVRLTSSSSVNRCRTSS